MAVLLDCHRAALQQQRTKDPRATSPLQIFSVHICSHDPPLKVSLRVKCALDQLITASEQELMVIIADRKLATITGG